MASLRQNMIKAGNPPPATGSWQAHHLNPVATNSPLLDVLKERGLYNPSSPSNGGWRPTDGNGQNGQIATHIGSHPDCAMAIVYMILATRLKAQALLLAISKKL